MKYLLIFFLLTTVTSSLTFSQSWTKEEMQKANTAKEIGYLTEAEKNSIMYINLARLYPQKFAEIELPNYFGPEKYGNYLEKSTYRKSLIKHLQQMKPVSVLVFDKALYENAKCFAKESGEKGIVGHQREKCPSGNYAECCSYGMDKGKDIALQWLIDHDVPSLGHRINCLNGDYNKIGLSIHSHKTWEVCAVAEIIW